MVDYLDSVTLRDLVDQQLAKERQTTVVRRADASDATRLAPAGPNSVFNMARS